MKYPANFCNFATASYSSISKAELINQNNETLVLPKIINVLTIYFNK